MSRTALPVLLAVALVARGAAEPRTAADYEVILDKAPFGPPPPTAGASADAAAADAAALAAATADAREAAGPPPPAPVRLSSIARFGGVASAGLVEVSSGRAFVLRPGEGWGPYRLLDADPDAGSALVAQGTNEFFVALAWARGQATNLVPSARAPYLTTFRPHAGGNSHAEGKSHAESAENAEKNSHAEGAETALVGGGSGEAEPPPAGSRAEGSKARTAQAIGEEEEAELLRRATVTDPDGTTHVSFRELNRLRVELRRRKAEEARAKALAEAEARRAEREREAAERRALEAEEKAEAEAEHRAAVVAALAQGYDVEVDFELDEAEAAQLREAGFDVPEGAGE